MKNITKKIFMVVILLTTMYFVSQGQTPVGGGIYSNTTWSLANSPYIVTDTVVVFPGVILSIEPGVTVKFENNQRLEIRQAHIISVGTVNDSITFTSNSSTPTLGIWSGIYLNECPNPIEFNYCNFKYAYVAIDKPADDYDTLVIKNSIFSFNYSGCGNTLGSSYSGLNKTTIDSCIFENNTNGIGQIYGVSLVKNSSFINNEDGIHCGAAIDIENCSFISNDIGINIYSSYSNIRNCLFDSNSTAGICAQSYPNHNEIVNCQITNNGIGIYDTTPDVNAGDIIKMNIIENNIIGIKTRHWNDTIYCNKICNNTLYDLYYNVSSNSAYFLYNDWGTTDSLTIASHIYDGYDNVSLGLVNFMPFDTQQCYLNGCNLIVTATVTNATCDTCHNGSAIGHVANGFAPYTWTWYSSPIQTTQTATGLAPGTYSLCVTDENGCTACNQSIFIDSTNCTGFSIVAHSTNATCSTCTDGEAWVDINGGTPPYTYTWYSIPMQDTSAVDNLGQGSYEVCVSDLYGCIQCDSVDIGVGDCSAYFYLYADTAISHHYYAVNMASGVTPLTYSWDWGDGNASDGPYPSHTYTSEGNYTICLSITDFVGCTNTHCVSFYLQKDGKSTVTIDVISDSPTEIDNIIKDNTFAIFPNPVNDLLTIRLLKYIPKGEIEIYNLLGQKYYSLTISNTETKIDVSGLLRGIYIIELKTDDNICRQMFIKQ